MWAGAPYLSVNVAGAQLEQPGFVDEVALALSDGGLDAARLMLEVTESSLVGDLEAERLQALRRLGVRLAIDDFGTGYSSLSYLRRFPMDVLKIDRSFTRDACDDNALLQAIVAMGESLGLVLIPEGIEEPEQADALRALGCRLGQGYPLRPPGPGRGPRGRRVADARLSALSAKLNASACRRFLRQAPPHRGLANPLLLRSSSPSRRTPSSVATSTSA